jgi:hypothetical protein
MHSNQPVAPQLIDKPSQHAPHSHGVGRALPPHHAAAVQRPSAAPNGPVRMDLVTRGTGRRLRSGPVVVGPLRPAGRLPSHLPKAQVLHSIQQARSPDVRRPGRGHGRDYGLINRECSAARGAHRSRWVRPTVTGEYGCRAPATPARGATGAARRRTGSPSLKGCVIMERTSLDAEHCVDRTRILRRASRERRPSPPRLPPAPSARTGSRERRRPARPSHTRAAAGRRVGARERPDPRLRVTPGSATSGQGSAGGGLTRLLAGGDEEGLGGHSKLQYARGGGGGSSGLEYKLSVDSRCG